MEQERRDVTGTGAARRPITPRESDAEIRRRQAEKKAELVNIQTIGPEDRQRLIAEAAYFRAQARGFEPGNEVQDWLAAEAEVDALLAAGEAPD